MLWRDPEVLELAEHSKRLRAMLVQAAQNEDSPRFAEYCRTINGLCQSLRIWLGRPTFGRVGWQSWRVPLSLDEAQRCLQRPELMHDGNWTGEGRFRRRARIPAYQAILDHADRGHGGVHGRYDTRPSIVDEGLLRVVRRVEHECERLSVPVAAELLYVPPEAHNDLWLGGLNPIPAERWPYCYGRAVKFGHLAEPTWSGWCLKWLDEMVMIQARHERVDLAAGDPGEFLRIDQDGVVLDHVGKFPVALHEGERGRMWEHYSAPWRAWSVGRLLRPPLEAESEELCDDDWRL